MSEPKDFVVGPIEAFPPGTHHIVEVGGREVGIYNVDDELYAVQNVCAHALAPICVNGLTGTYMPAGPDEFVYGMENRVLKCPWHGWEFDVVTGEALFGTDNRRLATFPATVVDGHVVVTMRERPQKTATTAAAATSEWTSPADG